MTNIHLSPSLTSSKSSSKGISDPIFDKQPPSTLNIQYFSQTEQKHQVREKILISPEQLHEYI